MKASTAILIGTAWWMFGISLAAVSDTNLAPRLRRDPASPQALAASDIKALPVPAELAGAASDIRPLSDVGGNVLIAAASDLVFALEELNAAFTNTYPRVVVRVSTGSSGNFYAQIRQGAPHDVFLSADIAFPEKLAAEGKADVSTLFSYAQGHLVLWTTRTNLDPSKGFDELTKSETVRIAIANPDTAPYGRAAKAALVKAGLWDRLQPKLVIGENIAQTAQFVERGSADAGIVAKSLVMAPRLAKTGTYWEVPDDFHPPLLQGAIVTTRGSTNDAARAYLRFLKTPAAKSLLRRFGLESPDEK